MGNLTDEYIKEFRREVRKVESKNIYNVPLPAESKNWEVRTEDGYYVEEVEDEYFRKLNGSVVWKLPKNTVAKKRKIDRAKRDFMRDDEGNYVYEDIKVPSGSIVVVSEINLRLPYKYSGAEGFGYVDFVEKGANRKFLYIVPRVNLYKAHQTALALSVKNMKNYEGMGYTTWRMGTIYLHIIPYNPNSTYTGTIILKTGFTLDYSKEIQSMVKYWQEVNVIPNIAINEIGLGNLVLKPTEVGYNDYIPKESLSLGDKDVYGREDNEEEE